MSLEGRIALVTGGSRGIGRSICLALAEKGADIIVNYVNNEQAAMGVVELCRGRGVDALAIQANIGVEKDVHKMFQIMKERFKVLDILVNNAGVDTVAPFMEIDEKEWDFVFDVNLKGILFCSQNAVPLMQSKGRGSIINITSILGRQVSRKFSHYCASKAAADMLTRCMAVELAPLGITVNAIAPGAVDTDMLHADMNQRELEEFVHRTPSRRLGTPDDIARAVAYLCYEAGDFLNGEVIVIDGGYTLPGDPIPV